MNEQDPPKYPPYEPTVTGMEKLTKGKENSHSFLWGAIIGIAIPVGFAIYGMQDAPIDYYPARVAPVASATQTPSRLNPVPATARNTNTPPTQPKMVPVQPGNTNPVPPQPSVKCTDSSGIGDCS